MSNLRSPEKTTKTPKKTRFHRLWNSFMNQFTRKSNLTADNVARHNNLTRKSSPKKNSSPSKSSPIQHVYRHHHQTSLMTQKSYSKKSSSPSKSSPIRIRSPTSFKHVSEAQYYLEKYLEKVVQQLEHWNEQEEDSIHRRKYSYEQYREKTKEIDQLVTAYKTYKKQLIKQYPDIEINEESLKEALIDRPHKSMIKSVDPKKIHWRDNAGV
jgi:hypothetical protein